MEKNWKDKGELGLGRPRGTELQLISAKVSLEDYSWLVRYSNISGQSISETVRKAVRLYKAAMIKKARLLAEKKKAQKELLQREKDVEEVEKELKKAVIIEEDILEEEKEEETF